MSADFTAEELKALTEMGFKEIFDDLYRAGFIVAFHDFPWIAFKMGVMDFPFRFTIGLIESSTYEGRSCWVVLPDPDSQYSEVEALETFCAADLVEYIKAHYL